MERKIDRVLYDWKTNGKQRVITICGPNRIGKTYSIDKFGSTHYENYLRLSLYANSPDMKIFEEDSDIETLRRIGMAHPEFHMVPGESLLAIDDAHNIRDAREAASNLSRLTGIDIVVAGSMSIFTCEECDEHQDVCVRMFPMDFEEYLWANGISADKTKVFRMHIAGLRPFNDTDLKMLADMFRRYVLVGGLPQNVASSLVEGGTGYDIRGEIRNVLNIVHTRIMSDAPRNLREKAYDCFVSVPVHLNRKNKRFRYVDVSSKKNSGNREYQEAVEWLEGTGAVHVCRNADSHDTACCGKGLGSGFKMYLFDTGLLTGMYEGHVRTSIYNGDLYADNGGAVENCIANMIKACGHDLVYISVSRRREDGSRNDMNVDFLVPSKEGLLAVEVRSRPSRSPGYARKLVTEPEYSGYSVTAVIRLEKENIRVDEDGVIHMPLFSAAFFDSIRPGGGGLRNSSRTDDLSVTYRERDRIPGNVTTVRCADPVVESVPRHQIPDPHEASARLGPVLTDDLRSSVEVGQHLDGDLRRVPAVGEHYHRTVAADYALHAERPRMAVRLLGTDGPPVLDEVQDGVVLRPVAGPQEIEEIQDPVRDPPAIPGVVEVHVLV